MRASAIRPKFVEFIPRELDEGVLYVSETHRVAVHLCASGCGEKVVTPLSPAEWQLYKDGDLVSLYPSIGNWNYACRSHYWIRDNRVLWAESFSAQEIAHVQARDRLDKERYVAETNRRKLEAQDAQNRPTSLLSRMLMRLRALFR